MEKKAKKTKKSKPAVGKYVSNKDAELLKKAQTKRSAFMFASTLTLAVTLFLSQEWAEKAKGITWLLSAYVLLIVVLVVISVAVSYGALRGCKLTGEISEKLKPRAGFEKRTFAVFEWFMYLHFVLAAAQIALVIYGFGIQGLVAAILSAAGAVLAYLARDVSFKTLKDSLVYLPPIVPETPKTEQAEAAAQNQAANDTAEKGNDADAAESFSGDGKE